MRIRRSILLSFPPCVRRKDDFVVVFICYAYSCQRLVPRSACHRQRAIPGGPGRVAAARRRCARVRPGEARRATRRARRKKAKERRCDTQYAKRNTQYGLRHSPRLHPLRPHQHQPGQALVRAGDLPASLPPAARRCGVCAVLGLAVVAAVSDGRHRARSDSAAAAAVSRGDAPARVHRPGEPDRPPRGRGAHRL